MGLPRRKVLAAVVSASAGLAGCARLDGSRSRATSPERSGSATGVSQPISAATFAYTHLQPTGNRVLKGEGDVRRTEPVDIPADGTPEWLIAFPGGTAADGDAPGGRWTVVTIDGRATTHRIAAGSSERIADHGPASSPPLGYCSDGTVGLVHPPADCAARTHPVPIDGGWLNVTQDGDVAIRRETGTRRFDVDAPGDVRIVALGDDRYALYARKTDRYRHGALGDNVEGSSLVVIDANAGQVETETTLDAPTVFEGLSPMAADLDGDGTKAVVTTVADGRHGARIRVYEDDGTVRGPGPIYGPGWRHQLCVAPFAPDGTPELAVVRKPHVDRTLEFYRLDGSELTVTATLGGYSSHTYGSRNLAGGLAADLDANGRPELLVPTADRRSLHAVRRTRDGAETAWELTLEGPPNDEP